MACLMRHNRLASGSVSGAAARVAPFGFDQQPFDHAVFFYLDEQFFLRNLGDMAMAALQKGGAAVIMATERTNGL